MTTTNRYHPLHVWWKRQDEWIEVFSCGNFEEAMSYAENNITHGHITQRIELRDGCGVLRTIYDSSW